MGCVGSSSRAGELQAPPCDSPAPEHSQGAHTQPCHAGMDESRHELLWAVLRLDRPMGLELCDLVRCSVVSRAFRELTAAHLVHLDFTTAASLLGRTWWQPSRLRSVTSACVRGSAVPQAAQPSQLRSLHLVASETVELRELSVLRHLTELHVMGSTAAGVECLPALRSLAVNPHKRPDLRALQHYTQLTALSLHTDGSCTAAAANALNAASFVGLCSLSCLQTLSLHSMHMTMMGGAQALSSCKALTSLSLKFYSCDCWQTSEDFISCSLAALTQLQAVSLHRMSHGLELDALDTHQMPGLQKLVLVSPSSFGGDGQPPDIRTPLLELQLAGRSWPSIEYVLSVFADVHRRAHRLQRPSFTTLRLSGWPVQPALAAQETSMQTSLYLLLRHGVLVETAAAGAGTDGGAGLHAAS